MCLLINQNDKVHPTTSHAIRAKNKYIKQLRNSKICIKSYGIVWVQITTICYFQTHCKSEKQEKFNKDLGECIIDNCQDIIIVLKAKIL